ncbi:MAG: DNA-3-methyladenine glycosylase I, partial [Oceanicaulis sp.]|nr:DNA-3-methyladenine glycosylase I [Oceanicaulis sp.]
IARLLDDAGIIRSRAKIEASIGNAKSYLALRERGIGFSHFLWDFVDGEPVQNRFASMKEVPAETPVSQKMSKALKAEGFKFCGPVIVYAFMQATGLVNDHLVTCFRHEQVKTMGSPA